MAASGTGEDAEDAEDAPDTEVEPADEADAEPAADAEPEAKPAAEPAATTDPEPAAPAAETPEPAESPSAVGEGVNPAPAVPESDLSESAAAIRAGYAAEGALLPVGVLLEDGEPVPGVDLGLPLATLNRHALVAGATGTGKTRTLQLMAEGLSAAGVPALVTDVKGDLTGLLQPGPSSDKLLSRTNAIGQRWEPTGFPVELLTVGEAEGAVPVRTTVSDFGPLLMSKVLGLNETQESALQLIFHWADTQGLALVDLGDLRSVIDYLGSDEGKQELRGIGGISSATAGVILREVSALAAQGAEEFFGETAFDTAELLRLASDGRGYLSVLRLPKLNERPQLLSTFVMWLLADLFSSLPEVGDADKPKLVFFFDEAHLLFNDASTEFLRQVVATVRLVRSKGVGVVFVTQSPTDVPEDVLAQLGGRVQHALRAHTPKDAAELKKAVTTFPTTDIDLAEVLTSLGTGEAVVTVLNEDGSPTPVAVTRILAPASVMGPASDDALVATLQASGLLATYGERVDPESATELLAARIEETARQTEQAEIDAARAAEEAKAEAARKKAEEKEIKELEREMERERKAEEKELEQARRREERAAEQAARRRDSLVNSFIRTAGNSVIRSIFGNRRRR
ncbi:MAG: helicase HerA-like domain-containing protein [Actinomycetaceae bacterium]